MKLWQRAVLNLVTVGVAAMTASLGWWQWGRGQEKEALHARLEARVAQSPIGTTELLALKQPTDELDRRVRVRGEWLPEKTLYLENRVMRGQPGFYVLTPLRIGGGTATALVQRGWIPRSTKDRSALASVATPAGSVEIEGRIAPPPSKLMDLGAPISGAIRHNVDLSALASEWRLDLLPVVLIEEGAGGDGLLRDWPQVAQTASKNFGYAFQWWALCALTIFLNVWFQFIAPRRRRTAR